ncbi:MAG TPA: hypothetical protein PKI55_05350 [Chitinophagaceae bacterium]|nr:hypothetical protein [Chitinophagaceae bacterium]
MMYAELYQYLIQYKQLPVPGIGTFLVERIPAAINFPERKIEPPVYGVSLQPVSNSPSKSFFIWLGAALQVSDREAVIRYNDFAFDLKSQLSGGDIVNWNGVGQLSKGLAGDIKFIPQEKRSLESSVKAEKVMREKAEHMVRVGEDEKTSAEMTELLSHTDEKKSYWWAYALIVIVLSVMFIGWYFSENGISMSSTSNSRKLVPAEVPKATYKAL